MERKESKTSQISTAASDVPLTAPMSRSVGSLNGGDTKKGDLDEKQRSAALKSRSSLPDSLFIGKNPMRPASSIQDVLSPTLSARVRYCMMNDSKNEMDTPCASSDSYSRRLPYWLCDLEFHAPSIIAHCKNMQNGSEVAQGVF